MLKLLFKQVIPLNTSNELTNYKKLLYECPDIRRAKVTYLKTRIHSGKYKIKANHIVEDIIRHGTYVIHISDATASEAR